MKTIHEKKEPNLATIYPDHFSLSLNFNIETGEMFIQGQIEGTLHTLNARKGEKVTWLCLRIIKSAVHGSTPVPLDNSESLKSLHTLSVKNPV